MSKNPMDSEIIFMIVKLSKKLCVNVKGSNGFHRAQGGDNSFAYEKAAVFCFIAILLSINTNTN